MVYVDAHGIPLTLEVESAQKAEVKLALQTVDQLAIETRPLHAKKHGKVCVADKGYDAQWLREALRKRGMKPKIPKKRKRGEKEEPKYNETLAEYYKTRWIVERTISWFGAYRRILIRWERDDDVYEAFVTIACIMICLRKVLI